VYYDQPPFFEKFCIYQGYNPTDLPVTFEPSVMCIHDNDSKCGRCRLDDVTGRCRLGDVWQSISLFC
jgi:hypothetical protein